MSDFYKYDPYGYLEIYVPLLIHLSTLRVLGGLLCWIWDLGLGECVGGRVVERLTVWFDLGDLNRFGGFALKGLLSVLSYLKSTCVCMYKGLKMGLLEKVE